MPKRFVVATLAALLTASLVATSHAQDETRDDFWPEVDAYKNLGDHARVMLMAASDRSKEGGLRQATVGAMGDYFVKPFARDWLRHRPDAEKKHTLMLRAGYRYTWDVEDSPTTYKENRLLVEATVRASHRRFFFLNRNRVEWRDVNDEWSWRYRNRTRVEGDFSLRTRAATPYLMAEFFYDSRYNDWNRQLYYVGTDWPILKTALLDVYYCRQNDSESSTAHVNAIGATLKMYF